MEEENVAEYNENDFQELNKGTSKFFKFFCGGGLVVTMYLFWFGLLPHANLWEIGLGWAIVYGLGAGTIDINIFVDKLLGGRK